jgi:hypothetical protein
MADHDAVLNGLLGAESDPDETIWAYDPNRGGITAERLRAIGTVLDSEYARIAERRAMAAEEALATAENTIDYLVREVEFLRGVVGRLLADIPIPVPEK